MPRRIPPIPAVTSKEQELENTGFPRGINTFSPNDALTNEYVRLAQDARMSEIGTYKTRQGFDYYSAAHSQTADASQTSAIGAADKAFNTTTHLAQPFTAVNTGRLTRLDVQVKNSASATGTVMVKIYSDSSNVPGTLLATSSIAQSDLTSSYATTQVFFSEAPEVTATSTYWIVLSVQANGDNSYYSQSTTSGTTALTSSDSGTTWSATTYDLYFDVRVATNTHVSKGLYWARKSDGSVKKALLGYNTFVGQVDEATGTLSSIGSGLSSSATKYRFDQVNDIVYIANGYDSLRKWDYTTFSTVSTAPVTPSNLLEHKGLLFLQDASDPDKWHFSNFAEYETYTSTDFIYVPAPKSGDPTVAAASLNGALFFLKQNNKYGLYGDDNATFQLMQAPGTKGTYSQETVTSDKNYIYFVSDDGLYRFNGTADEKISDAIFDDFLQIANKDKGCLVLHKDRLYFYYPSSGSAHNDSCIVFNLFLGITESFDTGTYVSRAVSTSDEKLLVASSLVGAVYQQESSTNDYTNLGAPLQFEIRTHYNHYGAPSRFKEIRQWKPRFLTADASYEVSCQYATDLRNSSTTVGTKNLQSGGSTWGTAVWGSFTWGSDQLLEGDFSIPGEHKRIQLRIKHHATRQPVEWIGDYQRVEIRRRK